MWRPEAAVSGSESERGDWRRGRLTIRCEEEEGGETDLGLDLGEEGAETEEEIKDRERTKKEERGSDLRPTSGAI